MLLALVAPALALGAQLATPGPTLAQETRSGIFHFVWTDPAPGALAEPRVDYFLAGEDGGWYLLELGAAQLEPWGGAAVLNGARVTVSGSVEGGVAPGGPGGREAPRPPGPQTGPRPRIRSASLQAVDPGLARLRAADVLGTVRYVTILCRFADSPSETPHPSSTYLMWNGLSYPGQGDYWDELSAGQLSYDGTEVVGWYDLPLPLADYFQDPAPEERLQPNLQALAQDCVAVADPDVDFSDVDGVNLQFNQTFGASWGGGWTGTADGEQRSFGTTWLADWSGQSIYAHEVGHTFGLPHSSGPYGQVYDSSWDVMSNAYVYWDQGLETYVGQHTIAFHRAILGWIGPERRTAVQGSGTSHPVRLEFWGVDPAGAEPLMAIIPLSAPGDEYTVEARRLEGYDAHIPYRGVILHKREGYGTAKVVDPDGDGNPNDLEAVWIPGEAFHDSAEGVTVEVVAGDEAGYDLVVTRGWILAVEIVGEGQVSSAPAGLDCAESCMHVFPSPTQVTLTAEPAAELVFAGWEGACTGEAPCELAVTENREVTALFLEPVAVVSAETRPAAVVGAEYESQLEASGGTGSYLWTLIDGTLPEGLTLGGSGLLQGIPRQQGTFGFTARVASSTLTATASFTLEVEEPTLASSLVFDQLLGSGTPLSEAEVRYLEIIGNENGRLDAGDVRAWLQRTGALSAPPPSAREDEDDEATPDEGAAEERGASQAPAADAQPGARGSAGEDGGAGERER